MLSIVRGVASSLAANICTSALNVHVLAMVRTHAALWVVLGSALVQHLPKALVIQRPCRGPFQHCLPLRQRRMGRMGLLQIPRAVFVPPTPIKLGVLTSWLADYTHAVDAQILRDGFSFGFSLGYTVPRQRCDAGCLGSAAARPNVVFAKLNKDIKAGRIAGPFSNCPLERLRCSPIGLVPKKAPGTFRLIHHLSFPQGQVVNAFIDKDKCKVDYASFDVGVRLVLQAGCSAWLAKADIKSAFRLLPVSPRDYELLGFKFGANSILTSACRWDVPFPAHSLRSLALFWSSR